MEGYEQLSFEDFPGGCECFFVRDAEGRVVRGYACSDCLRRALAFLEDLLYLDKAGSVSARGKPEAGDID